MGAVPGLSLLSMAVAGQAGLRLVERLQLRPGRCRSRGRNPAAARAVVRCRQARLEPLSPSSGPIDAGTGTKNGPFRLSAGAGPHGFARKRHRKRPVFAFRWTPSPQFRTKTGTESGRLGVSADPRAAERPRRRRAGPAAGHLVGWPVGAHVGGLRPVMRSQAAAALSATRSRIPAVAHSSRRRSVARGTPAASAPSLRC